MSDPIVVTRSSKLLVFDRDQMLEATSYQGAYNIHCFTPRARWLLSTLVNFFGDYHNRFQGFGGDREIDQIATEALEGLICPMACEEDFQALVSAVQGIGLSLIEIRDRLGPEDGDLDEKVLGVSTSVDLLTLEIEELGLPTLIDKIEPILNGVGVILGAPTVPL